MNVVPLIWSPLIAASVAALIPITVGEWGSCAAAKKCCDGQDLDCMAEVSNAATPHYGADEYEETEPCYCDNGCLEVGDCCPDFKEYCGGKSKMRRVSYSPILCQINGEHNYLSRHHGPIKKNFLEVGRGAGPNLN